MYENIKVAMKGNYTLLHIYMYILYTLLILFCITYHSIVDVDKWNSYWKSKNYANRLRNALNVITNQ